MTCPICKKPAGKRPDNPSGPFCSERCRSIDLGSWLSGDYAIPGEPVDLGPRAANEDSDPDPEA